MRWRTHVTRHDALAVRSLVDSTGFFSDEEVALAEELVNDVVERGAAAGYEFLFAEAEDARRSLRGYSCFGRIPATRSSFDLYWIAVAPDEQGRGLGREIVRRTEDAIARLGGTRVFVDTSGRTQYAPTRAFYERVGYSVAARLDDFYAPGDAKVIYARSLDASG